MELDMSPPRCVWTALHVLFPLVGADNCDKSLQPAAKDGNVCRHVFGREVPGERRVPAAVRSVRTARTGVRLVASRSG